MIIKDKVYGEFEIKEQVLIDLINSNSLQRLKGISQQGLPQRYYHRPVFSRYEHSIGVMTLLRKFGAKIEEQIAGLIHDISHTAFSHNIDWVIGNPEKENYQDSIFNTYLTNSDIPNILEKHNLSYTTFLDLEKFTLLEQDSPKLCADRIDYSLREMVDLNLKQNVSEILEGLKNFEGKFVFSNEKSAELFAVNYSNLQREHWAGDEAKIRYHLLSQILKQAIKIRKTMRHHDLKVVVCLALVFGMSEIHPRLESRGFPRNLGINLINMESFSKDDEYILSILENSDDNLILNNLTLLKNGFEFKESTQGIELKKKSRYVNPDILINGNLTALADLSENYRNLLNKDKNSKIKKLEIISK